jgi:hypothetical protein
MATERLSMRYTREILRQKLTLSRSHRAIARGLGISSGTVGATVLRARAAGLDWSQVEALTDDALEVRLYRLREAAGRRDRPGPDCAALHAERRNPDVTLELLHLEYLELHRDGYRYTQFCAVSSYERENSSESRIPRFDGAGGTGLPRRPCASGYRLNPPPDGRAHQTGSSRRFQAIERNAQRRTRSQAYRAFARCTGRIGRTFRGSECRTRYSFPLVRRMNEY